jgi:anhydro-N-acetylmuramic acid kinase
MCHSPGQVDDGIFVGLISGTSMDGIDAVVVEFGHDSPVILAADTMPFEPSLATALETLRGDPDHFPSASLARLDASLGDALGQAALDIIAAAGLEPAAVAAIGSHGQTALHRPDDAPPHTLQIGDPHRIASITGITTIADFRRADLAAGGQGAPLAPLLHRALFARPQGAVAVLNLGGIANLTLLTAIGEVRGFDTGPANCLLDDWYRRYHSGRFDADGRWAASGRVDPAWLAQLLEDPYFARTAPKSTGIEYFSRQWLDRHLPPWAAQRPADIQATLAELTARSIAEALPRDRHSPLEQLLVCGGGVHNGDLLARLGRLLPGVAVASTDSAGIDPDFVEALLFAWLARERLAGRMVDTGPVTGAHAPILAGTIVAAPPSNTRES